MNLKSLSFPSQQAHASRVHDVGFGVQEGWGKRVSAWEAFTERRAREISQWLSWGPGRLKLTVAGWSESLIVMSNSWMVVVVWLWTLLATVESTMHQQCHQHYQQCKNDCYCAAATAVVPQTSVLSIITVHCRILQVKEPVKIKGNQIPSLQNYCPDSRARTPEIRVWKCLFWPSEQAGQGNNPQVKQWVRHSSLEPAGRGIHD